MAYRFLSVRATIGQAYPAQVRLPTGPSGSRGPDGSATGRRAFRKVGGL